ncbi:hypothetical protein pdam_00001616, partial [Pocillopora damicornis]
LDSEKIGKRQRINKDTRPPSSRHEPHPKAIILEKKPLIYRYGNKFSKRKFHLMTRSISPYNRINSPTPNNQPYSK